MSDQQRENERGTTDNVKHDYSDTDVINVHAMYKRRGRILDQRLDNSEDEPPPPVPASTSTTATSSFSRLPHPPKRPAGKVAEKEKESAAKVAPVSEVAEPVEASPKKQEEKSTDSEFRNTDTARLARVLKELPHPPGK